MTLTNSETEIKEAYDAWFDAENRLTAYMRRRRLGRPGVDMPNYDHDTLVGYYDNYKVPLVNACEQFRQLGYLTTDDLMAVSTAESLGGLWAGMEKITAKLEPARLKITKEAP